MTDQEDHIANEITSIERSTEPSMSILSHFVAHAHTIKQSSGTGRRSTMLLFWVSAVLQPPVSGAQ